MTVSAQEAIETVLIGLLRNASPLWGVRVQAATVVDSKVVRPYIHYFPASDMQPASNPHHKKAELVYSIKGVSASKAEALAIREAITELMDDSGDQDIDPRLPYHAGWRVTTVSVNRAIWLEEYPAVGEILYHAGHQYQIMMERR